MRELSFTSLAYMSNMFAKGVNRSYFSKLIKKLSSSLLLIVSAAENASSTIGYLQILPILFKRKRSSSLNNPKTCANCCMAPTAIHRDTAFLFFHVIWHHDESSNAILGNYTQKNYRKVLENESLHVLVTEFDSH